MMKEDGTTSMMIRCRKIVKVKCKKCKKMFVTTKIDKWAMKYWLKVPMCRKCEDEYYEYMIHSILNGIDEGWCKNETE